MEEPMEVDDGHVPIPVGLDAQSPGYGSADGGTIARNHDAAPADGLGTRGQSVMSGEEAGARARPQPRKRGAPSPSPASRAGAGAGAEAGAQEAKTEEPPRKIGRTGDSISGPVLTALTAGRYRGMADRGAGQVWGKVVALEPLWVGIRAAGSWRVNQREWALVSLGTCHRHRRRVVQGPGLALGQGQGKEQGQGPRPQQGLRRGQWQGEG
ncbi:unnamed protein product [Discosporangium mesarthrocarpum]